MVKESLFLWNPEEEETVDGLTEIIYGPDGLLVGSVSIEIVEGNVVVTVTREDEARFGPVSLVVV